MLIFVISIAVICIYTNIRVMDQKTKICNKQLTPDARKVLELIALKKDKDNNVIETPSQLFRRIAKYIARVEKKYNYSENKIQNIENEFYQILNNLEFQCESVLTWAGLINKNKHKVCWTNCFVLPVKDSLKSIFKTLKKNILIQKNGGCTGFNFSRIRSTYARVTTTGEFASGPVKYLRVYNQAQDTIIGRDGRQMNSIAILNIDHPNIEEFISLKENKEINHYNTSVGITDKFMTSLQNDNEWKLVDPYDKKVYKKIKARKLFDKIAVSAWKSGEPGLVFIDEMERYNPTPLLGTIDATNPCGEQTLIPYESCILGSINLSKMVKGFPYLEKPNFIKRSFNMKLKEINWSKLNKVITIVIEFLDNILDISNYPIKKIKKMTKMTRNIGLGLMGLSDLFVKLGIPYDSDDAIKTSGKIMKFLTHKSQDVSQSLGKERGNFPTYKDSLWHKKGYKYMRNSRTTSISSTRTISTIAGCNPGIEPIFKLIYKSKSLLHNENQIVINQLFEQVAKIRRLYSTDLINQLLNGNNLSDLKNIPNDVKDVFKTSSEIKPLHHVRIQAEFQKYCDNAISKSINLPNNTTVNDIEKVYKLAYKLKCKEINIYREGSKTELKYRVIENSLNKTANKVTSNILIKPRPRPMTTSGMTTKIKTDQGNLFITINEDKYGIAEVFLSIGKSGGVSSGYCEAIGRLISVSLRADIKPEVIIDQLKEIRTSSPTLNKGMFVYSVPDAIAKVFENYLKERKSNTLLLKNIYNHKD